MNNEYLLGYFSARLTKLLSANDFDTLKKISKKEFIDYLFNSGITKIKEASFEKICKSIKEDLRKEISKNLDSDNLIYKYFLEENDDKLNHFNGIYEELNENNFNISFFSKLHLIKNLELLFRMLNRNEDLSKVESNLLLQNEVSIEFLIKAYNQGKDELIRLTKELTDISINKNMSIVEIEKTFDNYFSDFSYSYGYSGELYELLIYYIYMSLRQIETIKRIYYIGDKLYKVK